MGPTLCAIPSNKKRQLASFPPERLTIVSLIHLLIACIIGNDTPSNMDFIQLAPYNDTMRLGQGYNSFLQLQCLDDAVKIDASELQTHVARADPSANVSQVVSYNS